MRGKIALRRLAPASYAVRKVILLKFVGRDAKSCPVVSL